MLIIYTKNGCYWCDEALIYLRELGIPFEERNVNLNENFSRELLEKSNQTKCPTLDLYGVILADVGKEEIEVFLKTKDLI